MCAISYANDCGNPTLTKGVYLHANNIRTLIAATGSLFWDGLDAQFYVEGDQGGIATIYSHGLWLGALDANHNVAVAAAQYGAFLGDSDYYPGPVAADGTTSEEVCGNYDRAWTVYRYEIEAHLADFQDNGVIDNPLPSVIGWPGRGNDQFFASEGFELPLSAQGLAPFNDLNGDGIYQPLQGEYPVVPQSEVLPDQLVWSVFNTIGNQANESGSANQLVVEVHLLAWAFFCSDNALLNNSIFASYKVINRGTQAYSDFRLGLWTDFDLGCQVDDYLGSAPAWNTYYVYNKLPVDAPCAGGAAAAGDNPPVQAITVLNRSLDGFINIRSTFSIGVPAPFNNPVTAAEYYNYLNNRFRDGTPLTNGGFGYDPASSEVVNYVFPGDPNDPLAWSAFSANLASVDQRGLGNIALSEPLAPGQSFAVDVAYSYHREPGAGHLGNVSAMYSGVAALQAMYDNAFAANCTPTVGCTDDCIWSGDLNADGIANHEDVIALGFGLGATGSSRVGPYNWAPQSGESWSMLQLNGTNSKHLDANGSGSCTLTDLDKTIQHYNHTRPSYTPVFEYPMGEDLNFYRLGSNSTLEQLEPGRSFFAGIDLLTDVPDLRGLAFSVEYDPVYFTRFELLNDALTGTGIILRNNEVPGQIDYALFVTDATAYIQPMNLLRFAVRVLEVPEILLSSDKTFIKFRNIRAFLTDGTAVDLGAQRVCIQINNIAVSTQAPAWGQAVQLFPNPVRAQLFWQFGEEAPTKYALIDLNGRLWQTGRVLGDGVDLATLPSGVYQLQLYNKQTRVVRKIVKF